MVVCEGICVIVRGRRMLGVFVGCRCWCSCCDEPWALSAEPSALCAVPSAVLSPVLSALSPVLSVLSPQLFVLCPQLSVCSFEPTAPTA